jgi:hypothetical protein
MERPSITRLNSGTQLLAYILIYLVETDQGAGIAKEKSSYLLQHDHNKVKGWIHG